MNQTEFSSLLNVLVAVLLSGNIYFLKKLMDQIEKSADGIQNLNIRVAILESKRKRN